MNNDDMQAKVTALFAALQEDLDNTDALCELLKAHGLPVEDRAKTMGQAVVSFMTQPKDGSLSLTFYDPTDKDGRFLARFKKTEEGWTTDGELQYLRQRPKDRSYMLAPTLSAEQHSALCRYVERLDIDANKVFREDMLFIKEQLRTNQLGDKTRQWQLLLCRLTPAFSCYALLRLITAAFPPVAPLAKDRQLDATQQRLLRVASALGILVAPAGEKTNNPKGS